MFRRIMKGVLLLLIAASGATIYAQTDDGFSRFYADFQKAVKTDDREKVASTIPFDHFDWEASEAFRKVKSKEAFLKNYDRMLTPAIKNRIATGKPIRTNEGYLIMWHTKSLEYSLYFFREKDGGYSFLGLTIGPR